MQKSNTRSSFVVLTISTMLGVLLLSACGDSTATPATSASTTAAATTAASTSTTAAAVTTAAPAVATTAAPAVATTAAPAAATTASTSKVAPAGKVTIGIGGEPSTLDPQSAEDGNERAVNDNIYETLLVRQPSDMQIAPGLAEKFEQKDLTTWRFTLRKGIKFHNGEDFNADSVVTSITRILDPAFKSEQLSFFGTLDSARKVDDYTVDILTKGPDPILPSRMYWMKIVPAKYSQTKDIAEKPVGTGPFKFVEWKRNQSITLTANDSYWGTAPSIKDVIIRPFKENSTKLPALKTGDVDLVTNLLPEQVSQAPKSAKTTGVEFPMIRLATRTGPLANAKVRQAINYAVDKESIIKNIYGGNAELAQGQILRPDAFGFNPEVKAYPFDPEKAKALLKEAGAEGLAFDLVGESGRWLKDKEVIEAVGQQLTKVGLKPNIKINEWSRYLDQLFATENPPHSIFVSNSNELFDADRAYSAYFACKGRVSSYCNDDVDKLLDQARAETDVAKRTILYKDAMKISRDDAAMLFLVNISDIYGMTQRLDWKPRHDGKILVTEMKLAK
ncbi:MAG: transporter substrate-binding protein [Chloroflexi bacterium]|jgi:peptide/nickel transport system substrate-binding protein|nr:transporter substrate-binding protein [Chloroflexota bacterium]